MKKILTLMAAMSACAGTAMASDFNFANHSVDAKEKGSALTYNETDKAFSLPLSSTALFLLLKAASTKLQSTEH